MTCRQLAQILRMQGFKDGRGKVQWMIEQIRDLHGRIEGRRMLAGNLDHPPRGHLGSAAKAPKQRSDDRGHYGHMISSQDRADKSSGVLRPSRTKARFVGFVSAVSVSQSESRAVAGAAGTKSRAATMPWQQARWRAHLHRH